MDAPLPEAKTDLLSDFSRDHRILLLSAMALVVGAVSARGPLLPLRPGPAQPSAADLERD